MAYFMIKDGNEIHGIGTGILGEEITEQEYNNILSIIHDRPTPPTGYDYKLRADTLTWELVEVPVIEPTDEEATESDYITALQDLGVDVDDVES